jgi:hypothetical protein
VRCRSRSRAISICDEYFIGKYLLALLLGGYFVACELATGNVGTDIRGDKRYTGYTKRILGLPYYVEVWVGMAADVRGYPVRLALEK